VLLKKQHLIKLSNYISPGTLLIAQRKNQGIVTVTVALSVPELLIAVSVYVVVSAGNTTCEKFEDGTPISGSIVIEVAPMIFHVSVDVPPGEMLLGVAVKECITGCVPSVAKLI
jgi:hypothetical protein